MTVGRRSTRRTGPVSNKAPDPETRTALQRHVDFFDTNHDGRITVGETYSGLRRLGFDITRSLVFAAVINGGLGPSTSRKLSLTIETERIHLGKHGSDSGVYDGRGHFSAQRFAALFSGLEPGAEGGLDAHQLRRMIARNRTDVVGHLASRVEFALLMEIAGEIRNGRRVLTRERLEKFYDGSLLYKVAARRRQSRVRSAHGAR